MTTVLLGRRRYELALCRYRPNVCFLDEHLVFVTRTGRLSISGGPLAALPIDQLDALLRADLLPPLQGVLL